MRKLSPLENKFTEAILGITVGFLAASLLYFLVLKAPDNIPATEASQFSQTIPLSKESIKDPDLNHFLKIALNHWKLVPGKCMQNGNVDIRLEDVTTYKEKLPWQSIEEFKVSTIATAYPSECNIRINKYHWKDHIDTSFNHWKEKMCNTIVHEWGHLLKLHFDNQDKLHSPDPNNIMHKHLRYLIPACNYSPAEY